MTDMKGTIRTNIISQIYAAWNFVWSSSFIKSDICATRAKLRLTTIENTWNILDKTYLVSFIIGLCAYVPWSGEYRPV
jgi:hypothetical protein